MEVPPFVGAGGFEEMLGLIGPARMVEVLDAAERIDHDGAIAKRREWPIAGCFRLTCHGQNRS